MIVKEPRGILGRQFLQFVTSSIVENTYKCSFTFLQKKRNFNTSYVNRLGGLLLHYTLPLGWIPLYHAILYYVTAWIFCKHEVQRLLQKLCLQNMKQITHVIT